MNTQSKGAWLSTTLCLPPCDDIHTVYSCVQCYLSYLVVSHSLCTTQGTGQWRFGAWTGHWCSCEQVVLTVRSQVFIVLGRETNSHWMTIGYGPNSERCSWKSQHWFFCPPSCCLSLQHNSTLNLHMGAATLLRGSFESTTLAFKSVDVLNSCLHNTSLPTLYPQTVA